MYMYSLLFSLSLSPSLSLPSPLPPSLQLFILNVQLAIIQQWLIPTALHSLQPFKEMDWAKMVERWFLLAVSHMISGL